MVASIDMNRLREITDGDPALEQQLFQLYLDTADRVVAALEKLIDDQSGSWSSAVHELKGASANMHIDSLLTLCREMERLMDVSRRRVKLDELTSAYAAVRSELIAATQSPQ